jgi:hypothetical protein
VKVEADARDVTLTLRAGGMIAGVVKDEHGAPVASFTILVTPVKDALSATPAVARSFLAADGHFEIADLEPGDVRVQAIAHGHAPSKTIVAHAEEKPAPVELALTRGGTVRGVVIDADTKKPLELARVSVEGGFGGSISVPLGESTITDDNGAFELTGLAAGPRSIVVGAYAHHARIVSDLSVDDGATLGPITIEVRATKDGEQAGTDIVGIGVKLHGDGDALVIDQVIPGGAAAGVGLVAGDAILAVDGTPCATLGMTDSLAHIRGVEGSTVRLTIRKLGANDLITIDVVRRRIPV